MFLLFICFLVLLPTSIPGTGFLFRLHQIFIDTFSIHLCKDSSVFKYKELIDNNLFLSSKKLCFNNEEKQQWLQYSVIRIEPKKLDVAANYRRKKMECELEKF